jgi:hypothetical protein
MNLVENVLGGLSPTTTMTVENVLGGLSPTTTMTVENVLGGLSPMLKTTKMKKTTKKNLLHRVLLSLIHI